MSGFGLISSETFCHTQFKGAVTEFFCSIEFHSFAYRDWRLEMRVHAGKKNLMLQFWWTLAFLVCKTNTNDKSTQQNRLNIN